MQMTKCFGHNFGQSSVRNNDKFSEVKRNQVHSTWPISQQPVGQVVKSNS